MGNAGALTAVQDSWQRSVNRLTQQGTNGNLPVLALDITFENYRQLLQQREGALANGVLLATGADFYPATIQSDSEQIPVRLRLLPGAAQHLGENEQWNFEVETRDNRQLLGFSHLNLLDPADNGGLAEWAFMKTLESEQLPAAGYDFRQLILNGVNRGTYAVQQAFGSTLPGAEGQPARVIVAYDALPLWDAVSYFGGDVTAAIADPVTNFAANDLRFVAVENNRDPLIMDDEVLAAQMDRAQALLLGLQRGELTAAEVFDVEQYGRFLALADLWGAPAALSPFHLRYVYDPAADRLTPIGFNGRPLAGDMRVPLAATYQDPQIQAAYAAAAAHYSSPAFLADLQAELDPQLSVLAQAMGNGINSEEIWSSLAERQGLLRRSLQPAQPVIAQLGPPERAQDAVIEIHVANAINLPVEVLGFDINGATFLDVDPSWITAGAENVTLTDGAIMLSPLAQEGASGLDFVTFELPVTEIIKQDQELEFLHEIQVRVGTRLLGLEATQLTPAAAGSRTTTAVPETPAP